MSDHDPLCPGTGPTAPFPFPVCVCAIIAQVRADERERMVRDGWVNPDAYRANVKILRELDAAVIDAARAWVERIVDPPNLWADEEDFALIKAVRALDE